MRAVHNCAYVEPAGAFAVVEIPEPPLPGRFQVLVGMDFSCITHDDLKTLSGRGGPLPLLPSVAGIAGMGTVLAVGPSVEDVKVGEQVVLPRTRHTWTERLIVQSAELVPVEAIKAGLPQAKGCSFETHSYAEVGQFESMIEQSAELIKLLLWPGAGIAESSESPKVFPLWKIRSAVEHALAGCQVLLDIRIPPDGRLGADQ
ncbi:alcohol dehydrogenase catalytic domain-containing protein [Pseudomonas sp. NPDC087358]|uniref:alcohol dehydrogenase catalytic domain-containing protein n=1 Tax=Pseudomonas sp. NPDC087358 TaxID=3364439 RepID=UPI00384B0B91